MILFNSMKILTFANISYILLAFLKQISCSLDTCDVHSIDCQTSDNVLSTNTKQRRYLLYDVNPGEGFNLRRDVYMRIATVVKRLNEADKNNIWNLVLPPWGPLYHWKTRDIGYQAQINWSMFFNLDSLKEYISVMELEEFLNENGPIIDVLYYLQHYVEGWTNWEERVDIRDCIEPSPYNEITSKRFQGWFWGYNRIYAKEFHCLSIQGYSSTLKNFLIHSTARVIMVDRAEVILHDRFGDSEYWMVRRSMSFSNKLISIGNDFRRNHLNSTDEQDQIKKSINIDSPIKRDAVGGPYISVHLRRRDFIKARPQEVPSIKFAAQQIKKKMSDLNLELVFIASDAYKTEMEELRQYIPGLFQFIPSNNIHRSILDGGVAIVDQWICAHSRYFLGTYESTFSFRIQEEREILGFPVKTTFNRLCGNNETKCQQPSKWTIVF